MVGQMEKKEENKNSDGWVWVVVSDKDGDGHYLGLYSEEQEVNFIPTFPSKEAANDCFLSLPRKKGEKYEVQAIHLDELNQDAEKSGFTIAMVDSEGKVIK
jgi:hypothetical protein